MQIDSLGRISWPTTIGNIGTQHIVVRAINGGGLSSLPHAFDLNVVADTQAPAVVIRLSRNRIEIGSSVTVLVSATDQRLLWIVPFSQRMNDNGLRSASPRLF